VETTGTKWRVLQTDQSGNFYGTVPAGTYNIQVTGYDPGMTYQPYNESGITIAQGATATRNIVLSATSGGSTIYGQVRRPDGSAFNGAFVKAYARREDVGLLFKEAAISESGSEGAPGTYSLPVSPGT
jgi:hypothetical protein